MAYDVMMMHLPMNFANPGWIRNRETTMTEYKKLIETRGEPFYASDLGLCGGVIGAMHRNNWIRKTGETKTCTIQLPIAILGEPDPKYPWWRPTVGYEYKDKEVEIFQWVVCDYPRAVRLLGLMVEMAEVLEGR